jgi:RHS repeat-associated protein
MTSPRSPLQVTALTALLFVGAWVIPRPATSPSESTIPSAPPEAVGQLWIAVDQKVLGIDPGSLETWVEIPLAEEILDLEVDPIRGRLWILTGTQIAAYDLTGDFRARKQLPRQVTWGGLAVDPVSGEVWIVSDRWLWTLGPELDLEVSTQLEERTQAVAYDREAGNVWAWDEQGLSRLDRGTGVAVERWAMAPLSSESRAVEILPRESGTLWIASSSLLTAWTVPTPTSAPTPLRTRTAAELFSKVAGRSTLGHEQAPKIIAMAGGVSGPVWVASGQGDLTRISSVGDVEQTLAIGGEIRALAMVPGEDEKPELEIVAPEDGAFLSQIGVVEVSYFDTDSGIQQSSLQIRGDTGDRIASECVEFSSGARCFLDEDLTQGEHRISVSIRDRAGNPATESISFTVDREPPVVELIHPARGQRVPRSRARIVLDVNDEGAGVDPSSVEIHEGDRTVEALCESVAADRISCLLSEALEPGVVSLVVRVRDRAGNLSEPVEIAFLAVGKRGSDEHFLGSPASVSTTIVGVVQDDSGVPQGGVEVFVLDVPGASVQSAPDGSFSIPDVSANEPLTVVARPSTAPPLLAVAHPVTPVVGGVTDVGILTLEALCNPRFQIEFTNISIGVKETSSLSDTALALAVFDDGTGPALYVGGRFNRAGGLSVSDIAKWDGRRWLSAGFSGSALIRDFEVGDLGDGNKLFYVADNRVNSWDGQTLGGIGGSVNTWIEDSAIFDDGGGAGPTLYIGGFFSSAGGQAIGGIARWNGSQWEEVGRAPSGNYLFLEVLDDGTGLALYAGLYEGSGGLWRWDGSSWKRLGNGLDRIHDAVVYDDGSGPTLYIGHFTGTQEEVLRWTGKSWELVGVVDSGALGGEGPTLEVLPTPSGPVLYAAGVTWTGRWDGSSWSTFGGFANELSPATDQRDLAVFDSGSGPELYVGGNFFSAGGIEVNNIARLQGSNWLPLGDKAPNDRVRTLTTFDDGRGEALFLAGDFASAGGIGAAKVARWDGLKFEALGDGLTGSVNELVPFGGELWAAGQDVLGSGIHAAKWDGATWSPNSSGLADTVTALQVFDDGTGPALYAGVQGTLSTPLEIRRWDGVAWQPFATGSVGSSDRIEDLEAVGSGAGAQLYAGGIFSSIDGVTTHNVAVWDGTSWQPLGTGIDNWIRDLIWFDDGSGGALYAGGFFSSAGGLTVNNVARWDLSSWAAVGEGLSGTGANVITLHAHDDGTGMALYAAGAFTNSGSTSLSDFARWDGTAWTDPGGGVPGTTMASFDDEGVGFPRSLFVGGFFEFPAFPGDNLTKFNRSCPDTTPPEIFLVEPPDSLATQASEVTFIGSISERGELSIDGTFVDLETDLSFVHGPVPLVEGSNSFLLEATDRAGLKTQKTVTVNRDLTPPSLDIRSPAEGATIFTSRPEVELGHADSFGVDGSTLALQVNGSPLSASCVTGATTSRCQLATDLPDGSVTLTATIADRAGNVSSPAQVTFTVDASSGSTDTTVTGTVTFATGQPAPGARVMISGHEGPEVLTAADGSFSVSGVDVSLGEPVSVEVRLDLARGFLRARVDWLVPVPGGVTAAGTLVLMAPCAAGADPDLFPGIGVGGVVNARIMAMVVFDDGMHGASLYAGGDFIRAGGIEANNIARWDGQSWHPLASGLNGAVRALEVWDDGSGQPSLFVGGSFTFPENDTVTRLDGIGRWDGSSWSALGSGVVGSVYSLKAHNDGSGEKLYAGGRFSFAGVVSAVNIASWDGTAWAPVGSGLGTTNPMQTVYSLETYVTGKGGRASEKLFAGGDFGQAGTTQVNHIAMWDGTSWQDVGGGVGPVSTDAFTGVYSMEVYQGSLVAAGRFSSTGPETAVANSVAAWDGSSWTALGDIPGRFGVFAARPQGIQALLSASDGFLYALGSFDDGIVRWDGAGWETVGGGFSEHTGGTALIEVDDGVQSLIYAGGGFSRIDETVVSGFAAWDGNQWQVLDGGINAPIRSLAIFDDGRGPALIAGGEHLRAGTADVDRVSRFDGVDWEALGGGLKDGQVEDMVVFDDGSGPALYVAGDFTVAGGSPADYLARWDGNGWSAVGGGLDRIALALEVYDDGRGPALYVGGSFTQIGGQSISRIARWDGSVWEPVGAGATGTVRALEVFDDGSGPALYAAGAFAVAPNLARWDGVQWTDMAGDVSGLIEALEIFDDGMGPVLIAGGNFGSIGGILTMDIARWDGSTWSGFGGTDGGILALETFDDGTGPALYVGGGFNKVDTDSEGNGGRFANNVAFWDGSRWRGLGNGIRRFRSDKPDLVWDLQAFDAEQGPVLYIGGEFDSLNDVVSVNMARWRREFACDVADTVPPTLSFTSPNEGSIVATTTPELHFAFSDDSSGAVASSLTVRQGGVVVPITCSFTSSTAACTPDQPFVEGSVALEATITDAAGNVSAPATVSFTIVIGPPTLDITAPTEAEILATGTPTVALTYSTNADPATLSLTDSEPGVTFTCTTSATSATCSPDVALSDGAHLLTATIENTEGEVSTPTLRNFVVDTELPVLAIDSPIEGSIVTTTTPAFGFSLSDSGSGVDQSSLALTLDGAALSATCTFGGGTATCTPDVPLSEAAHTLTATIADLSGKTSAPASRNFTVSLDTTPPVITLTSPVDGSLTIDPQVIFTGSLDEQATVTLDGSPVSVAGDLSFSHGPVTLAEGVNRFVLEATDAAGNSTTLSITVQLDTLAPVLSFLAPTDLSVFDPSLSDIELRWGDQGSGVETATFQLLADGVSFPASCTACSTGVTCTVTQPFTSPVVTLSAQVSDLAGNSSSVVSAKFTSDPAIDILPPVISLVAPSSGSLTNASEVQFIGQLSESASLTLDGSPVAVAADLSFDHGPVALVEGLNSFVLEATDAGGNVATEIVNVTRDSINPSAVDTSLVTAVVGSGGFSTVTGSAGAVADTDPGTVVVVRTSLTRAEARLPVSTDGSFTGDAAALAGDELELQVEDPAGNSSLPRTILVPGTPPAPVDPAAVAPAIDPTAATDLCSATAFLYSGTDPVQTGVAPGAVDCDRVALLRGRVLDPAGSPLSGVRISVEGQPEFGSTRTRLDGAFDLVARGGGVLSVRYATQGRLVAQRTVEVGFRQTKTLPDVVLVAADAQSTIIDLTAPIDFQVARGSVVTDASGTRQASLLVPPQAPAGLVLAGGQRQAISTLTVRATEYTVGANGPQAMPAILPATSGYTYAVEFSVDEAEAAGAGRVEFSTPVISYTENFVSIPTGTIIPVGFLDRDRGAWVPSEDGRVIEILGVTGGLADLDLDGSGVAADATALAALGIIDGERQQLAGLYLPGQTLWRVRISHFTTYDYNLPYRSRFSPPDLDPRGGDRDLRDDDCLQGGSILECTNMILGEDIGITGSSMALHYRSNRVPGRTIARTLEVPVSDATVPPELQGIELEITVAGQKISQAFPAQPNQSFSFIWDGKDGFGRTLQGRHPATTRLTYLYDSDYTAPENCDPCFGDAGGATPVAPTRAPVRLTSQETRNLGVWNALESERLGGWTLSPHHVYDPIDQVLHLGTGERRTIRNAKTIQTVAGGLAGDSGDGGSAKNAQLAQPTVVEVAPPVETAANPEGGGYYVLDRGNCRVRQVKDDGTVVAVAGAGCGKGVVAEDIPATEAKIARPRGLTVAPDGDLFIADWGDPAGTVQYIWRVDPESGKIYFEDSTPASFPRGMTTDEQGYLYYCGDTTPTQIWRVELDGSRTLVAGGGSILNEDDIPSKEAFLGACADLAFNPNRDQLYLVEEGFNWVRRVTYDGLVQRVAGTGAADFFGDDGPARDAALNLPGGIDFLPDGTLLIADSENNRIRAVSRDGFIFTTAGSGDTGAAGGGSSGDEGPPTQAQLHQPMDVAVTPEGDVLIADQLNNRVRSMGTAPSGLVVLGQEIRIPSQDGGAVYVFDDRGRHLRTEDSRTGEVLLQFGYQDFWGRNLLVSVIDAFGNTTTVERNATTGDPTGILAPFGQRTDLTLHPSGYLATVTNPASETVSLTYSADGLLTALTDPRMGNYLFEYDSLGRLTKDTDPAGSFTSLSRTDTPTGFTVTKSTNLGRSTVFSVENLPGDVDRRTTTLPDGVPASVDIGPDGNRATTYADGSTVTVQRSSDPRLGLLAPRISRMTLTIPGGLSQVTTSSSQVTAVSSTTGEPAEVTDTVTLNGRSSTSVRNLLARTTTTTSAGGRVGTSSFDLFGRIAQSQVGNFTPVSYSYDPQGRLSTATQGTRTVAYTYDPQGRVESITDPMSRVVRFEYDLAGRVTKQILPDLREILFSYDANGNMTSITPPSRPSHSFSYSANDLAERYTPPDLGPADESSVLTYNLDRQITQVARPDGKTIDYTYDPTSGRLTTITTPRGGFGFTYDATTGQVTAVTDPDLGSLAFTYDGPLVLSTTWTGAVAGSVEQSYNSDFQVASQTVNGLNPVAFAYGADGEVTQAGGLTLTYDPVAAVVTDTSLGAVTDSLTYDNFGDLAGYSASFGGSEIYASTYTRDDLGRITQKVETGEGVSHTFDYTYDDAGRLTRVDRDGVLWAEYTWDGNSNRLTATDPLGSFSGTYDDHDRLLTYGSASYTYTANGELASKTVGSLTATYVYDVLGQLRKVVKPDGITVEYGIDAAGRRVSQSIDGVKVQGFLYGGGLNPLAELDGTGAVVSRFVYGASGHVPEYLVKGGSSYRLITDELGSVRLVVDASSGAVIQRLDYDPFGQVLLDTNSGFQPFGFAGGLYDFRTGLVRFGARDYDPQTGRWTAKDPVRFAGGDTNLYGYVVNDPINLLDPLGTDWMRTTANISAGIGDALLLGFGDELRALADRTFGLTGSSFVDRCSLGYRAASITTSIGMLVASVGRLVYAGIAKGLSISARLAGTEAAALRASTLRDSMKIPFRLWLNRTARIVPAAERLKKYRTAAALSRAVGRTDPLWNSGGVLGVGGALNAFFNLPECGCEE